MGIVVFGPSSRFLAPLTICTSMVQVASIIAITPVSQTICSPGCRMYSGQ